MNTNTTNVPTEIEEHYITLVNRLVADDQESEIAAVIAEYDRVVDDYAHRRAA